MPGTAGSSAELAARHGAGVLALLDGDNDYAAQMLMEAQEGAVNLDEPARLGRIVHDRGILEHRAGRYEASRRLYAEAIGILQSVTGRLARECEAYTWGDLGRAALEEEDYPSAREAHLKRLAIWTGLDSQVNIGRSMADLSTVAQHQEDWALARDLAEQALAVYAEDGNEEDVAFMQRALGYLEQESGQLSVARAYYQSSMSMSRALKNARGIGESLRYLGALSGIEGDTVKARELLDRARAVLADIGDVAGVTEVDEELALLQSARQN